MWVFYLISLPLTLGMVLTTLKYFAGPDVPRYVLFTVGYTWFCSLSIIILVPADIWTTIVGHDKEGIAFFWSWSYWSTFALTWAVAPIIQGYEDAGDFTVQERLRSSMRENLVFYLSVASVGLLGLILLIVMHKNWGIGVVGLAMACSNTFGLVTGAFLLGFGLSEIPKSIWKNAEWGTRQKVLSHKVAKMAANLDKAHQDLSNAIVISQATSKQMSKRDPLRPCMDVIDDMLVQMFSEDPAFEQTGGTIGENDMDYDADEKSMASLRRQLRRAREEYYRYRSTYRTYVTEALQLDDTIKNYDRGSVSGWKFVSSFRSPRAGTIGEFLDRLEWMWRCMLKKQLKRLLAVLLGCISAAILLAESTLLPSVDLSIFSILIKAVGRQEVLVQVAAFIPLMYMCICTYYSLFKIGMLTFYSLTPRQSSSVSLLMICSMVARYAPPISYNFLNLIRLHRDTKTIFEKRMGSIDDAVPFFGRGFNRIYPLIMVVYTLLVASNFFGKVIILLGKWKRLTFQNDSEDASGFDSSGVMILRKERMLLEQRVDIGEHVIPLAKNLNDTNADAEGAIMPMRSARNGNGQHSGEVSIEMKSSVKADVEVPGSMPFNDEAVGHNSSRETDEKYYDSVKEHQGKQSEVTSSISLPEAGKFRNEPHVSSLANNPSGLLNSWASMKSNFQNFRANLEAKRFLPLRQMPEVKDSHSDSSESLDDIFEKLKRRPERDMDEFSEDG